MGEVSQLTDVEGAAEAVRDDERILGGKQPTLSGDVIALPSLERPPVALDGKAVNGLTSGAKALDAPAARQKAMDVVRAAVDLADKVESQARDAAAERLRRADEDVRERRQKIEERETELERLYEDAERQSQQAAESTRAA